MKAVIVTGGHVDRLFLKNELNKADFALLIGVDGGGKPLKEIGVMPHAMVGDFDSLDETLFDYYMDSEVQVIKYPSEKDMTDTDIGIEYVLSQGADEVYIYGGSGTRFDHTLGNVMVLEKYLGKAEIIICDRHNRIQLIEGKGSYEFKKEGFRYISLIPLTDAIRNLTTKGMKYPLKGEDIIRKGSLGISNEIIGERGSLTFEEGLLLVIRSND